MSAYELIPVEERTYYTYAQLIEKFDNKWLFLTDYEEDKIGRMLRAKVAVISHDEPWGGYEEGIYECIEGCGWDNLYVDEECVDEWD